MDLIFLCRDGNSSFFKETLKNLLSSYLDQCLLLWYVSLVVTLQVTSMKITTRHVGLVAY